MKKLIIRVVGVLFLVRFLIYLFYSPRLKFDVLKNPNKGNKVSRSEQINKSNSHAENPRSKEGVSIWIGKGVKVLTSKLGQADRVYPSRNGYKSYVFKDRNSYYIVSAKREKVVSVYATGEKVNVSPLEVRRHSAEIFNHTSINPEPSFEVDGKKCEFELSNEDLETQTLTKYGGIYTQVYSDQQSRKVLSVRFLTEEMLADIELCQLNSNSTPEEHDRRPVEQNLNQLISLYEATNEMRELKGLRPLKINSDLTHIASNNLYEATSNSSDGIEFTEGVLKGQLDKNHVTYKTTTQNVGYAFNGVPTLIHSWMNSDIHRSRLLNSKCDEMGGDVVRNYCSLIFLKK